MKIRRRSKRIDYLGLGPRTPEKVCWKPPSIHGGEPIQPRQSGYRKDKCYLIKREFRHEESNIASRCRLGKFAQRSWGRFTDTPPGPCSDRRRAWPELETSWRNSGAGDAPTSHPAGLASGHSTHDTSAVDLIVGDRNRQRRPRHSRSWYRRGWSRRLRVRGAASGPRPCSTAPVAPILATLVAIPTDEVTLLGLHRLLDDRRRGATDQLVRDLRSLCSDHLDRGLKDVPAVPCHRIAKLRGERAGSSSEDRTMSREMDPDPVDALGGENHEERLDRKAVSVMSDDREVVGQRDREHE